RDDFRALAIGVAARQSAGAERELRQRTPDLSFEVKDSVKEVVHQRRQAAVHVRRLAALGAIGAAQGGTAVQAACRFGLLRALAGARFDGVRSEEHTSELQSRENLVCR